MDKYLKKITRKKQELDKFRPLPPEMVKNLEDWFRIELTYTSNAIEGNTLTRQETAMVVEKGLTVEGKTMQEHLEATNHALALDWIKNLVDKKRRDIKENVILDIHKLVLQKINERNAGKFRSIAVKISGSEVVLPGPLKVPELMENFVEWLNKNNKDHIIKITADAHLRFVSIHPFIDGNGRVARLLMNLILMQEGYPPAIIRKEDRKKYVNALEKAQLENDLKDYYQVIYEAVERSLDVYLDIIKKSK